MKKCSRCGDIKSRSLFNNNKSRLDGLDEYCKACRNAYQRRYNGQTGPNKQERELQTANCTLVPPAYRARQERREKFVREYVENLGKNML